MISGHNPLGLWDRGASYVFTRTTPIWGWATWRRAWARYDSAMTRWGEPEARTVVRSRMPATEYRVTTSVSTASTKGASTLGTSAGRLRFWSITASR
jgi:hypothetical protein